MDFLPHCRGGRGAEATKAARSPFGPILVLLDTGRGHGITAGGSWGAERHSLGGGAPICNTPVLNCSYLVIWEHV